LFQGFQNIPKIPELKRRIFMTLLLLAVYRIGVHVPTPGIDASALAAFFAQAKGTLFGFIDMFSGGAFERLSVFALGIMPYISSSIILQLLTVVVPHLERLSKEGEAGRKKITQYTRYGTVVLSLIQGFGISVGLERMTGPAGEAVVLDPGWAFRLMTMISLTAGTAFIMWLGEQITERGIGNGISLIIFAGIVARMPTAISNSIRLIRTGEMGIFVTLFLIVVMVGVVGPMPRRGSGVETACSSAAASRIPSAGSVHGNTGPSDPLIRARWAASISASRWPASSSRCGS
jgi:preprotein translocase subunit SecY